MAKKPKKQVVFKEPIKRRLPPRKDGKRRTPRQVKTARNGERYRMHKYWDDRHEHMKERRHFHKLEKENVRLVAENKKLRQDNFDLARKWGDANLEMLRYRAEADELRSKCASH